MFTFFKTFFIISLVRRNKKKILLLLSSIFIIILTIYFTDDLVNYIEKEDKKIVFIFKWIIITIFSLVSLIIIKYIFKTNIGLSNISVTPSKDINKVEIQNNDIHRERIKSTKTFKSKGESIIEKHSKKNV